jgi:pimeloyl-ACP methyl ester carboxylesterase
MEWLRGYIHQKGYQEIVLAGHSLGGAIALLYVLKYPEELKALILIGTGGRLRVHPMILAQCHEGIKDKTSWVKSFEPLYANIDLEIREMRQGRS